MSGKYGISRNVSGVYKITNTITGDFYIGSSQKVTMRFSNHLNRDARRYYRKDKFHTDVIDFGKENYKCELLEECAVENLLEREQYYFDILHPKYNQVRPCKNHLLVEAVKKKAKLAQDTQEYKQRIRKVHDSKDFKLKCKLIKRTGVRRDRKVDMFISDTLFVTFSSISTAARWVSKNKDYVGKNKTSKIKAVCDGERNTAYGFRWRYSKV